MYWCQIFMAVKIKKCNSLLVVISSSLVDTYISCVLWKGQANVNTQLQQLPLKCWQYVPTSLPLHVLCHNPYDCNLKYNTYLPDGWNGINCIFPSIRHIFPEKCCLKSVHNLQSEQNIGALFYIYSHHCWNVEHCKYTTCNNTAALGWVILVAQWYSVQQGFS